MTRSQIGERAEAAVLHALVRAGKHVLIPFSQSSRYDLVIEDDQGFHRVQCKSGRVVGEALLFFHTCSHTGGVLKDYLGEIDFFGVYCPQRDEVYLVPVEDVPPRGAQLRLAPPRNGQVRGIRWARDYLLAEAQV